MPPLGGWDAELFAAAQDLARAKDAVDGGANINASNPYDVTPLLEAAGQGYLERARFLVAQGAEIDYTGMNEGSPRSRRLRDRSSCSDSSRRRGRMPTSQCRPGERPRST